MLYCKGIKNYQSVVWFSFFFVFFSVIMNINQKTVQAIRLKRKFVRVPVA